MDLVNPEMAYKKIVVMSTNQFQSNDFRNTREASILEHSLNVFPFFRKLYSPQFFYVIVIVLQV